MKNEHTYLISAQPNTNILSHVQASKCEQAIYFHYYCSAIMQFIICVFLYFVCPLVFC